jgi:hypothetical protein
MKKQFKEELALQRSYNNKEKDNLMIQIENEKSKRSENDKINR